MGYKPILQFTIIPAVLLLLLSFVSMALTTHYWIIGDWILTKGVKIIKVDERTQVSRVDETIVYYIQSATDATIVSGCLCLTAGIVAIVAWTKLRKARMDTFDASTERRFWVLAVVVTTLVGFCISIASLALHYADKGGSDSGCRPETLQMAGKFNTNEYCTREMAACNFLPQYLSGSERSNAVLACNEIVTVKWIQVVLAILSLVLLVMFSTQARLRRSARTVNEKNDSLPTRY